MDLLWFGGQSNMEGETGAPMEGAPVEGAWEYKLRSRGFAPLECPTGEEIPPYLGGATNGCGSLLPDFCRAYCQRTGRQAAAVHTAKGATTIDDWAPGGPLYQAVLGKLRAALEDLGEKPGHIYFIWLQGESDALRGLSQEAYREKLGLLKDALKRDGGIERFGIIKVGYFAWDGKDEPVMEAQEQAAREDPDFWMLTRLACRLSRDKAYLNPEAAGHFNNAALSLIGKAAGETLGRLSAESAQAFGKEG